MFEKSFFTDCEGPLTLNDNAFEICEHFIDSGDKLFKILSLYDDYLVDIVKKPGYNAGNTLKLIVPFLKAQKLTNNDLIEFSKENVFSLKESKKTLKFISKSMNSYIVSTSYGQYIEAVCDNLNFPFENTFYTNLDLDSFEITKEEISKINEFKEIILKLDVENSEDLNTLDNIFFNEFPKMSFNKYLKSIKTVGGIEKELAIREVIKNDSINRREIFYIGDSITDCESLRFAKDNGGIAVSFNGNIYSLKDAEIAIVSENTLPTAIIADIFRKSDKAEVVGFINHYNKSSNLKGLFDLFEVDKKIAKDFLKQDKYPLIKIVTEDNIDSILKTSQEMRTYIRGESIGNLG